MLLGRFGGTQLSRNTLAAGVVRVGQAVQPVVNLLRDALLDSPIVHGDETEVQVLKEPGGKAQAKSCMWVQMSEPSGPEGTGPPIQLFGYAPSRSTQAARTLYEGMRAGGVLMSDGYEPYAAIAEQHRLVHLGCWAHCRRYFNDASISSAGCTRSRPTRDATHWMTRRCGNRASCTARRCSKRLRSRRPHGEQPCHEPFG